jgi:hypothetical protein
VQGYGSVEITFSDSGYDKWTSCSMSLNVVSVSHTPYYWVVYRICAVTWTPPTRGWDLLYKTNTLSCGLLFRHCLMKIARTTTAKLQGLRPKWHPIAYIVHYFWPEPYWLYKAIRVPFGVQPRVSTNITPVLGGVCHCMGLTTWTQWPHDWLWFHGSCQPALNWSIERKYL